MIVHVILFRPRPDLTDDDRDRLLRALAEAAARIPSIRGFRVGRRVRHGLPGYEQLMREDYEYSALIEFDDLDGLKQYLTHPAHSSIGRHFLASSAAALAYDYEAVDSAHLDRLIASASG
jgi:hypothetical protein